MSRRTILLASLVVVVMAAFATTASAHPAAPPPEYVTRLLHDCNDDWAGHSATRDGHDLIALDVQERYDEAMGGDILAFRLIMNGGYDGAAPDPPLKETITFDTGGQSHSFDVTTTDNAAFSATFDALSGPFTQPTPEGTPDGERFWLEGVVRPSTIGVGAGDDISNFFVQGYAGAEKADHLPGGFTVQGTTSDSCPLGDDQTGDGAYYKRPSYTLQTSQHYLDATVDPTSASAAEGENVTLTLTLTNALFETPQNVTITTGGFNGADVALHGETFERGSLEFVLEAEAEAVVHVYVTPGPAATSDTLRISVRTSLGGLNAFDVPFEIASTMTNDTMEPPATDGNASDADGGGAPGIPVVGLVVVTAGLTVMLRRRRGE